LSALRCFGVCLNPKSDHSAIPEVEVTVDFDSNLSTEAANSHAQFGMHLLFFNLSDRGCSSDIQSHGFVQE
jgi:hypothetical protein